MGTQVKWAFHPRPIVFLCFVKYPNWRILIKNVITPCAARNSFVNECFTASSSVLLNLFDVAAHFSPRLWFWAHFTKNLFQNSWLGVIRRVARRGAISPPIPKVAPNIFRSIKLLMSKLKKYFSANHGKCLHNLLHNLVEPDQSTVVQQLSMINQTLCTRGGAIIKFSRWSQGFS